MKKFLLYSTAFVVLSGTAEAACIQTPSCSSLGYSSQNARSEIIGTAPPAKIKPS